MGSRFAGSRSVCSMLMASGFLFFCLISIALLVLPCRVLADSHDAQLQDVMTGSYPSLNAMVTGSGTGWYGDSMRVYFDNQTGATLRIKIPIGLRLVPEDTTVQTMYTAGNETLTVPPGTSQNDFKAFCGEKYDSAPRSSNAHHPDGFADPDLMRVLERINQRDIYDSSAQDAVWHVTDNLDISDNEVALDLTGSSDNVSPGRAAAAGAGGAAVVGGAALLLNRLNGGGEPGGGDGLDDLDQDDGFLPDGGIPPEDLILPDDFEEAPPPPEDIPPWENVDERTGGDYLSGPDPSKIDHRTPPDDALKPPIDLFDPPEPPEDPLKDGFMIAGGDEKDVLQMVWDFLKKGRDFKPEPPAQRPWFVEPKKEGEGFYDMVKRTIIDTWGRRLTDEERAAQDEALRRAGQRMPENAPFGSGSKLGRAISDPVRYSQTGEGDPGQFIDQITREKYEIGGSRGFSFIRKAQNLQTATPPGAGGARDWSGAAHGARDFEEPDVKDWVQTTGVYKYDNDGHKAWDMFYEKHGRVPNGSSPDDRRAFEGLLNKVKSGQVKEEPGFWDAFWGGAKAGGGASALE